jgi:Family of unknown function (DUF6232)
MHPYYIGSDAQITTDLFESRTPIYQSFVIADLAHIHRLRDARWVESLRDSPQVGVCSTGLAGVCGILAAAANLVTDQILPSVGLVGAAVVGAAVAGAYWSARRRPLELRAVYRGQVVCLYRTNDRIVFNQVTRALLRVLEDHRSQARPLIVGSGRARLVSPVSRPRQ